MRAMVAPSMLPRWPYNVLLIPPIRKEYSIDGEHCYRDYHGAPKDPTHSQ